jgi:phage-related protein
MDDIIKQQMKKVDSDKKNKKKKAAKLSMKHTSKEPMPPQYTADTSSAGTSNAGTSSAGTSSGSSHNTVSDVELTSPQQSAVSSVSTCVIMSEPSTSKEDTHKQITLDVASINTIEHNNDTQQSIGLETVFRANDDDHIYSRNDIKLICTHFDIDFAKAEQLLRERQLE